MTGEEAIAIRAYMAGIIDGEGCLTASMAMKGDKITNFIVALQISNTSEELIDWIKDNFNGAKVRLGHNHIASIRNRKCWQLWFQGDSLQDVLELTLPYLVIKQRQAEIVLELLDLRVGKGQRIPPENRSKRIQLVKENQSLNQRGA